VIVKLAVAVGGASALPSRVASRFHGAPRRIPEAAAERRRLPVVEHSPRRGRIVVVADIFSSSTGAMPISIACSASVARTGVPVTPPTTMRAASGRKTTATPATHPFVCARRSSAM
jgi:hypothetical protein